MSFTCCVCEEHSYCVNVKLDGSSYVCDKCLCEALFAAQPEVFKAVVCCFIARAAAEAKVPW